ncbi:MAG: DnaJ domain-containing protein [Luteitalea sp.]|nr:DnaJ domain-containing protein [Luteitalea sp.]
MEFKDYYAVLGVPQTASAKEIKAAYRKLARKFHPDVNPGDKAAEARFKEVNEAHEVLGHADKRQKYDELGANWKQYEQMQNQPGAGAGGPFEWHVHTGPEGYRSMGPDEVEELFGQTSPFSEFFRTFFGGEPEPGGARRPGHAPRAARGRDIEHELEIALEEAFHGTTRRLVMQHGPPSARSGEANKEHRTVEVRVPAGVKAGARLRVSGEGERGATGRAAGDLYLRIRIAPNAQFERRDRDLYVKTTIPVTTAVLGGEVTVPTLAGRPVRLRVPAGTQSGQRMRVRGHGMPAVGNTGDRGDLYAIVDVQVPRSLTPEEREHYEALAVLGNVARAGTSG